MPTYNATSLSQLKSLTEAAAPGDTIVLANGTYTGTVVINNAHGTAANPIIITTAVVPAPISIYRGEASSAAIMDGGKGSTITNLLNEVSVPLATTEANTAVIRFSTCSYIQFRGIEVRNEGRGVHLDRCHHMTVSSVYAHRLWDRAIGGTCDQLTVDNCVAAQAALENYESRLFNITGQGGGWPGIIATYNNNGIHVNDFVCRNCYVFDSWGEAIAPFHCDGAVIEDCVIIDGSHTVGIYLDQCRDVIVRGCFIFASNTPPTRHDGRQMHGILVAREGTSFPYPSTGHVIYNNVIWGCEAGIRGWNDLPNQMGIEISFNTVVGCDDHGFEFEAFEDTPNITVSRNIIQDVNVASTAGFSFNNNWVYGSFVPTYATASGGFSSPTPTFAAAGNQSDPTRADYFCTNMVSSPFDHYGAFITEAPPGGGTPPPAAVAPGVIATPAWNRGVRIGISGFR